MIIILCNYGVYILTEIKGFAHFTAIVPTINTDSNSVVCIVEDIESVAQCIFGSDGIKFI